MFLCAIIDSLFSCVFLCAHESRLDLILQQFNIPGLGEPIRLLLAHCGVPFKDTRFKERSEFLERKPHLKYGQVPCLIVNGKELFQSYTIMRFIASSFDASGALYPSHSPTLAAECDGILDQIKDMMQGWGPLRYRERFGFPADLFPDEMAAKCQKNYLTEVRACAHTDECRPFTAQHGPATRSLVTTRSFARVPHLTLSSAN